MKARKSIPPANGSKRVHGYLWCKVCQRSWQYQGLGDPETWPKHRCGRDVHPFSSFLLEDPNHTALPEWKQEPLPRLPRKVS